jgi:uncharacterized integral membrane protein
MDLKLIAGLILASLVVLFAVQNAEPVEFGFLLWTFALSRALMMFILLAVGVLLGWMMHAVSVYRERRQHRTPAGTGVGGKTGASIQ